MYPGQIILLSARVKEGHISKAKFRLGGKRGGKAGAQGGSCPPCPPPAGAAHEDVQRDNLLSVAFTSCRQQLHVIYLVGQKAGLFLKVDNFVTVSM